MKNKYYILLILCVLGISLTEVHAQKASDVVFQIEVTPDLVNNQISLNWKKVPNVTGYRVFRKLKGAANFNFITDKLYNDTFFVDNNIVPNQAYEYAVYASHTNQVSGYVCAGMNLEAKHHQGTVLLVIDSTYIIPAQSEIALFKLDLIKEGWKVLVEYAGRTESPADVKQKIYNCNSAHTLEGVILLGHVPVPYSGNIAPDGHSDHVGAWPADVYYGDMCPTVNSIWQDVVLNNTSAASYRNHNQVGDGKYDASTIAYTNTTKIFVGRIDVINMGQISNNDVMLFKQYINKNHAYKASLKKFKKQGLIDDHFGFFYGEAFAQNGWRNMCALLGRDSIVEGDYLTELQNDSYLWSYACGGGWGYGATGIGITQNFASDQLESVFTMMYGSYFGDWDTHSNFLRAPIASPSSTLVSFWAGRPNWFMHNMALGEPIGYSYLNTVDNVNSYYPMGAANAQVHQALHGDPTLKMYVYEAPSGLEAFEVNNGSQVKLEWQASVDPAVVGYYVYRASHINGDFQLLNQSPVTTLDFIDNSPLPAGSSTSSAAYMVRAVKLEQTVTGSFYNLSPGDITEGFSSNSPLPVSIVEFDGYANQDNTNSLFWEVAKEENIEYYEVERSVNLDTYKPLGQVNALAEQGGQYNYDFTDYNPEKDNYYRLKVVDVNGSFTYHNKIIRVKQKQLEVKTVNLYPNPAVNNLKLELPSLSEGEKVDLYVFDMRGRVVLSKAFIAAYNNQVVNIDIERLVPGQYVMKCRREENLDISNLKFTKSN